MKLVATRKVFRFEDESGYAFDVTAEETPGEGWSATVTMQTTGYKTPEHAVRNLVPGAQQFIRQVREGVE
jgi:hypothetical protein